ncbi:lytic murein transglycosylase B [Marinomonas sp. 15G1-11]|uniref:Lytic murein transglycosylase B n=1 Tax=Marinomonas phaeophyticola TaxID=3004091 RepID=A0ABT4K035_9GAMM|nr:lytic murein transglycosylase B [Marinomonas sp. 15G1-11]MCZ2723378.1 lytic murein transglycosylase B [Marinomonas sp. 15G1-11]
MKLLWTTLVCFLTVSCSTVESKNNAVLLEGDASSKLLNNDLIVSESFLGKEDVNAFITYMGDKHGYDQSLLINAFSHIKPRQQVIHKSNNQPEVITPYYEYKKRFVERSRVDSGKTFLKLNKQWLDKAERDFGVPAEIIVAIAGVETYYGRITGSRDVFTSLSTLAFDYPRRGDYFRSELEAYLLLSREKGWPIETIKGSYSGALGMAQFMPSNYRKLAIDFDGDGEVDLWKSSADAIGSIANYLKANGWQANGPILDFVTVDKAQQQSQEIKSWSNKQRKPFNYPSTWKALGVDVSASFPKIKSGLIRLQSGPEEIDYWLAYNNFFALMSYNPSRRYTMAVIELSKLIHDTNGVK